MVSELSGFKSDSRSEPIRSAFVRAVAVNFVSVDVRRALDVSTAAATDYRPTSSLTIATTTPAARPPRVYVDCSRSRRRRSIWGTDDDLSRRRLRWFSGSIGRRLTVREQFYLLAPDVRHRRRRGPPTPQQQLLLLVGNRGGSNEEPGGHHAPTLSEVYPR